jgi:hypothetical protein
VHHIDGNDSRNEYENMIVLCHNCHQQFHQDKGLTRAEIEDRKRRLMEKTLTQYGLNALKIAARNSDGAVVGLPFLLYHLVELGYMATGETVMDYGGQKNAIGTFTITRAGRKLLETLFP